MYKVITKKGKEIREDFQAELKEEITLFERYLSLNLNIKNLDAVSDNHIALLFEEYFGCEDYKKFLRSIRESKLLE
ncbi:hypothetical protein [Bacillus infantis]|uniref:Uncharacterized protein n=1 Tax=Bacillus infantis TaxID=324767 RepID=A0A5D4RK96_9BACI|nr:hypothetical protein [Bacillus infantis]TYS51239.1 hypothetical protein FZD51_04185 [Bacillus infantis]